MTNPDLSQFVLEKDIAALFRPTEEALGLPGAAYRSGFSSWSSNTCFPEPGASSGLRAIFPSRVT